uniref:Uncharacterized protein n=1 Tax=Arundo donax TaxID=35708 RepID=A0A0A9FG97_ARUDO
MRGGFGLIVRVCLGYLKNCLVDNHDHLG